MSSMVFDRTHFDHMTGGELALQAEVLELFRVQAVEWGAVLDASPASQDWAAFAHKMKGSARGIGLPALGDACESLEAAAKSGADTLAERQQVAHALGEALAAIDAVNPPL